MSAQPELPQPDPELRRLDRLVGTWTMESNLVGSEEKNIRGETTFRGCRAASSSSSARIDFMGQQIDALELIGYDTETDTFPSTVFSGFSPTPLPYTWDVRGDSVTITVSYGRWTQPSPAPGTRTAPSRAAAPEPRRRRDRERPLRHRRAPPRVTPRSGPSA
jgi:hypothetical protein